MSAKPTLEKVACTCGASHEMLQGGAAVCRCGNQLRLRRVGDIGFTMSIRYRDPAKALFEIDGGKVKRGR